MLQLKNDTPFKTKITLFPDADGVDTLYVTVRATFAIAGGRLTVAEEQRPIQLTDEYSGDPTRSSLKRASEVHVLKPSTDVILLGDAWAPDGRPAPQVDVVLAVGPVKKTVRVFGDREWKGTLSDKMSSPIPFHRMPLVYERAFGGVLEIDAHTGRTTLEPRNPAGMGLAPAKAGGGPGARALPNLEDPAHLIARPTDRPPPAGFGPIAPAWEPRRLYAGTYDEVWRKTRAPYFPKDFSARFFNVAHPDLVCRAHLAGGEPVDVLHASPVGLLRFRLPRCEFDVSVRIARQVEQPPVRLESVILETGEDLVGLLFRSAVPCDKRALQVELVHVVLRGMDAGRRAA